jgi:hypothetical protein
MRTTISRSSRTAVAAAAVAMGASVAPVVVHGQASVPLAMRTDRTSDSATRAADDSGTRTHHVRRGDTLWDLGRTYLGDPFLWPEIYRLNSAVVEDPHWIYPGERLRLPGAEPAAAEPAPEPSSLFRSDDVPPAEAKRDTSGQRPAVRQGEVLTAPYVQEPDGSRSAGRIRANADLPGIAAISEQERLHLYDRVYVDPPRGAAPKVGDRYLSVAAGPLLRGLGEVAIPTGMVEIERVGASGEPSVARIVREFDPVLLRQRLVPLDTTPLPVGTRAEASGGPEASVIWIANAPVQPSLQHYLVLDAGARQGVRLGDQFTLYGRSPAPEGAPRNPEEELAVAEVVRVSAHGSTVLVVHQTQPAIRVGARARVTARLP